MQMSLEAITMLMRFHHRSCCSGIRGIFHPYLENNCVLKIGDTLPGVHSRVSFYFQQGPQQAGIWSELDRRRLYSLSFTELQLKQQTTAVYLQSYHHVALWNSALFLALRLSHHCLSITSKILLLTSQSNSSSWLQNITNILHVATCFTPKKRQMSVIVYTSSSYIKHSYNFIFSRSAVKQDKTCSGSFRTGAASVRSGAKPVARLLGCVVCALKAGR